MSDDAPISKRGTNPRSLANLIKSKPGDPSRNPTGKNGRTRGEYVAAWLEKVDNTDLVHKLIKKLGLPEDTPRIDALLQRDLVAGLSSSDLARKHLIEQYAGKPKVQMEVSGELDIPADSAERRTTSELRDQLRGVLVALAVSCASNPKADPGESAGPASPEPASAE